MNKSFHLIKKDLRVCAWWLLLWTALCFTHFGLRMHQLSFGDTVASSGFWSHLETTDRWDWQVLRWLPLLVIPFFMHTDPLVKRYAFWKSLPINRWRLVFAKLVIVTTFFVALPFVLEFIYLRAAGLTPMLGEALMMWGLRFLPLVVAVTLACYLTPGMLWGLPAAALLFVLLGSITPGPKVSRGGQKSGLVETMNSQPAGCRLTVDADSAKVDAETESYVDGSSSKPRRREISRFSVNLRADSLPDDVLIGNIDCDFDELALPDRSMDLGPQRSTMPAIWTPSRIPDQETSSQANNSGLYDLRDTRTAIRMSTTAPFSARVIPVEGGELKGTARATLVRKVLLKEMDVIGHDSWIQDLQRLTKRPSVTTGQGMFSFQTNFFKPLESTDPLDLKRLLPSYAFYSNGGMRMLAPDDCTVWITHKSLPYGRIMSGGMNTFADATRCRSLTRQEFPLSTREELLPRLAPLAKLRYLDEQAGPENWKLQFVRYEPVGRIDIPFSVHVRRPQSLPVILEEGDIENLGEVPLPFETQLAAIKLPENPSADDTRRALANLTEICLNRGDLDRHDPVIVPLMERMAAAHPEILFEETKRAADRIEKPRDPDYYIREYNSDGFDDYGGDSELWKSRVVGLNRYWWRVIWALIHTSTPERKELFLRYHSQQIDLMDAIHQHGWEKDALALMQGIAKREPVPLAFTTFISRYPSKETSEALLAQIRMGAYEFYRVLDAIDSGLVDGSAAANAAWDTTVSRAVRIIDVRDAFLLAVKFGVESAPRDLLRIIRSGMLEQGSDKPMNQRFLLSMLQALSVRSDCPVKLAEGVAWLEENAFELNWNPVSRRYEKSGAAPGNPWTDPPESLGKWIDPMGVGTFQLNGNEIRMTSRALDTYCDFLVCQRPIVRLMKEVKGDFTAEVTVDFPFQPSPSWNGRDDGIARNAGLIVEEGRYSFQRIFRNHKGRDNYPEIIEQIRRVSNAWDPRLQNNTWKASEPLRLKLCRHGDWFYSAWKQGDGPWNESEAQYNAGWEDTVRVGPYLCNKLIQPMEATFTGFEIRAGSEAPQRPVKGKFLSPDITPTPDGTALKGWGLVRNPLQNGEFTQAGEKLRIRSAPRVGNWSLDIRIGAPAVLQPVSGDFSYEVTVDPAPKTQWSSAVVVLCDPTKRFSYKVGSGTRETNKNWLNQLTWSGALNLWPEAPLHAIDFKKPLRIRMQRSGMVLRTFTRQEGDSEWKALTPRVLSLWPDDLEIGIAGVNAGPEEAVLEFENPVLVREPKQTSR